MNAPLTVTASGVYCALKMIADPKSLIPPNSGCWRPVTGDRAAGLGGQRAAARAGGLRQPRDLAPRRRHGDGGDGADHARHTVMAGSQGTSAVMTFGGTDSARGERYVSYEVGEGRVRRAAGQGRHQRRRQHGQQHDEHADRDPRDELSRCGSRNMRWCRTAAAPAPGAAGSACGACGACCEHEAHAAVCCERTVTPPFGLAGGQAGGAGAARSSNCPTARRSGSTARAASSCRPARCVVMEAPGSGGYGPPAARDPARLAEDLRDGYVSAAAARRDYGDATD